MLGQGDDVEAIESSVASTSTQNVNAITIGRKRRRIPLNTLQAEACCENWCIVRIVRNARDDVTASREHFQDKSMRQQHEWIIDYLHTHTSYEDAKMTHMFVVGAQSVCQTAWLRILEVPVSTFYDLRQKMKTGQSLSTESRQGFLATTTKEAICWLDCFAQTYGDKQPDADSTHLPMCLTKEAVFDQMCEELTHPHISASHFYSVWTKHRPNVKIPKVSRMAKCTTCVNHKSRIALCKSRLEKDMIQKERHKHLKLQNEERIKYYSHQKKAKESPDKYVSLIIDGMDQQKTELPHFSHRSTATEGIPKLKSHLVGVLGHGIGGFGFFDFGQWKHNANLTITLLVQTLTMMTSLPPVLYLQMDNCFRENKNRYLLGFLWLLVDLGVFKKIRLSFLMVGHTHEDIDRLFSRFSVWLQRHNAFTLDRLTSGFEDCVNTFPLHGVITDTVFAFDDWLTPSLYSIKHHSYPHGFKITKDRHNKTIISFRDWNSSGVWTECDESLMNSIPVGLPQVVPADYSRTNREDVMQAINKHPTALFHDDGETHSWWEKFTATEPDEINSSGSSLVDVLLRRRYEEPHHLLSQQQHVETGTSYPPVMIREKVSSMKSPAVGDMCVVETTVDEWPQICRVIAIKGHRLFVQWYGGTITTEWTPCVVSLGKFKRAFKEELMLQSVRYFGWQLTPSNKLPQAVKEFCQTIKPRK